MKQALIATAAVLAAASPVVAVEASRSSMVFELDFVSHVEAGMSEQDVLVERPTDPGVGFRASKRDTDLSMPLFAATESLKHNPMDPSTDGPYAKGADLGVTLGDWLEAKGSANYYEEDGKGRLTAEFEGLVPNGVYTMWHFFMSAAPTEPFIGTFDVPLGDRDGSQSVFVADAKGRAVFDQVIETGLQLTGDQLVSGLAIAWHSDGQTYGVLPGDFALNTHLQLFTALPSAE